MNMFSGVRCPPFGIKTFAGSNKQLSLSYRKNDGYFLYFNILNLCRTKTSSRKYKDSLNAVDSCSL